MSSTGIGALIGALWLARMGDFKYKGRFLIGTVFLFSIALTFFSLSKNYFLSIFILVFIGYSSVVPLALVNTLLQANVPDKFRGRVMSVFMITFAGTTPFGNLISCSLAQALVVSNALFLCGLICLALFMLINLLFDKLRKL